MHSCFFLKRRGLCAAAEVGQQVRGMGCMNGVCVGADSLPPALFYVWDASGRQHSCHGESETWDKRPLLEPGVV